jgi:hypothetical protein
LVDFAQLSEPSIVSGQRRDFRFLRFKLSGESLDLNEGFLQTQDSRVDGDRLRSAAEIFGKGSARDAGG